MPDDAPHPGGGHPLPPAIQWVALGTLTIYHITEQELDQLEKGNPESTYFGFAIFLISTGVSFLTSLVTTGIKSVWLFNTFFDGDSLWHPRRYFAYDRVDSISALDYADRENNSRTQASGRPSRSMRLG